MPTSTDFELNPHGCCPECGSDWDAGSIFATLRKQAWCEKLSDAELQKEIDVSYGKHGPQRFSRLVGISSMELDRVVAWQCPDCKHEWSRN